MREQPRIAEPHRRNASETRERLLDAAVALFAEGGFDRTTIRDIGQRAGVDPALIARYFGSKADLYLAAVRRHLPTGDGPHDLRDRAVLEHALGRDAAAGPSPTLHAAVIPHADEELQRAAMGVLEGRLIAPTLEALGDTGRASDRGISARARVELATAALAGVIMSRRTGAFAELSASEPAALARLLAEVLDFAIRPGNEA